MNVRVIRFWVCAAFLMVFTGVSYNAIASNSSPSIGSIGEGSSFDGVPEEAVDGVYKIGSVTVQVGSHAKLRRYEDFFITNGESDSTDSGGHVYAAVFDGHGGNIVAKGAQEDLINLIYAKSSELLEGESFGDAMKKAFIEFDQSVSGTKAVGTTATVVFIFGDEIYIAHVGDSRCVVKKTDMPIFATRDHTPTDADERARITAVKGVTFEWPIGSSSGVYRLEVGPGHIEVSRSLGDYLAGSVKPPGLIAEPEVSLLKAQECEFLILASDGLWHNVTSQEAIDFVQDAFKKGVSSELAAQGLIDLSCKKDAENKRTVPHDDMTVAVIRFTKK